MTCPICDQKPANCDCSPRERAMWRELREREGTPFTLTDAEREAVETAMNAYGSDNANPECAAIEATLWGLLERTK